MSVSSKQLSKDRSALISWYQQNKRILPWRSSRNPYKIWISEVMLQQTTVTAVLPFYEKFLTRFPDVHSLAQAKIEDVYEYWAGLGYYSRARNLHKAAQMFSAQGFPEKADELVKFPGLGPYTSRAVASLAFNEPVGVLDGNVIRVLSRKYGISSNWWETKEKIKLQNLSDELANTLENSDLNQGLMELGATVCTPKKVMCLMCPWSKDCISSKENLVEKLPLKKPKQLFQVWQWDFEIHINKNKIYLEPNSTTPFLKANLLPLSTAKLIKNKPTKYDIKHGVTKYDIFANVHVSKSKPKITATGLWAKPSEISKINPTSLMKKIIVHLEKTGKIKI